MKVLVEGSDKNVIEKLKSLDIPELEIVTEGEDLILDEDGQNRLMSKTTVKEASSELVNIIMEKHSNDFFKIKPVGIKPMKINKKKLKKRRDKNKKAKNSRSKNRK